LDFTGAYLNEIATKPEALGAARKIQRAYRTYLVKKGTASRPGSVLTKSSKGSGGSSISEVQPKLMMPSELPMNVSELSPSELKSSAPVHNRYGSSLATNELL
jgi:hypothetical protein